MRLRLFLAATGLVLTVAAFFYLTPATEPETTSPPKVRETPPANANRVTPGTSKPPLNPPSVTVHASTVEEEIEAAVVTYSPAALPTFEKLLASGEPDVREAARDGLVRLGETGGAALLRRASARLTDPQEIKKFLETADYLELPSALEGPLKK